MTADKRRLVITVIATWACLGLGGCSSEHEDALLDEPGASIGGDAIAEAIPSAQRVTIPATGHFPFVEQPEAFLDTVRAFLAR